MTQQARDLAIILLLSLAAAGASWRGSALAASSVDADLEQRVSAEKVDHNRTLQQPLVVLLMRTPVSVARRLWPEVAAIDVMRAGLALAATLWAALLFVTLRLVACRPLDAVLFTLLAMTSAASMQWFSTPAIASLASLSLLPALAMVAVSGRRRFPEWASALAVAASLAIEIVNGFAGGAAAWFAHPRRRVVQVIANGLGVVFVLVGVQQFLFPTSGSLSGAAIGLAPAPAFSVVNGLVLRAMVIPDGVAGLAGTLSWIVLLGVGAMRPSTTPGEQVRRYALLALAIQLLSCFAAGAAASERSVTVIPLLIVLASLGSLRTTTRPVVLGLAVLLLASAAVSNGSHHAQRLSPPDSTADAHR